MKGQSTRTQEEVAVMMVPQDLVLSHLLWTLVTLTLLRFPVLSHMRERAASRKITRF